MSCLSFRFRPVLSCAALCAGLGLTGSLAAQAPSIGQVQQLAQHKQWREARAIVDQMLSADPQDTQARFYLGYVLQMQGDHDTAYLEYDSIREAPGVGSVAVYNMACIHAVRGERDDAFELLDVALDTGFWNAENMLIDPDLASLREDPRFTLPRTPEFKLFTASNGVVVEYGLVRPRDFDPAKPYPVLVGFPPGNQSRASAEYAIRSWWGSAAARRGWVTVTLVRPDEGWLGAAGETALRELLQSIRSEMTVRDERFHVAGCSGGGTSSFGTAIALADEVASLTGLPAYPRKVDMSRLGALRDVHVNLWVGSDDGAWRAAIERTNAQLVEAGVDANLVVFPDEGHIIQPLLGAGFIDRLEASLESNHTPR